MKKTIEVDLPKDLIIEIYKICVLEYKTFDELVEEILSEYIKKENILDGTERN